MTTVREFRHSLVFQLIREKVEANAVAAGTLFGEAIDRRPWSPEEAEVLRNLYREWDQTHLRFHCAFLVKPVTRQPGERSF